MDESPGEPDPGAVRAPLAAVVAFYEGLTPQSLARIDVLYAPQARFKDPFNDVTGTTAIRRIFADMFERVDAPRFVVDDALAEGPTAFLAWRMLFRFRAARPSGEQCIRGATLLRFDAMGRVAEHRDYWDAAEELYEKLPVIGAPMRWLKRRFR